jgi:hypothetical protein
MKRKLFFILAAALLFVPWTVAYAYHAAAATAPVEVTPAAPAVLPKLNAYGHAIGGVTPGDLFLVDSSGSPDDTAFTLSITNTNELIGDYRYLNLSIGTYFANASGGWEKYFGGEGAICLTLQNGAVTFTLAGGARYKITIDKGCFYCYGAGKDGSLAMPDFYLTGS